MKKLSYAIGLLAFLGAAIAAAQGAYTHRFTNVDGTPFRAIGIELLTRSALGNDAAPLAESASIKKVLDNERVRGYRLTVAAGESVGPLTLPGRSVRVAQTAGVIEQSVNPGATTLELIEFEFK